MFIGKEMTSLKRFFAMATLLCVVMTAFCVPVASVAAEEPSPDAISDAGKNEEPQYAEIYVDENGEVQTTNIKKYNLENGGTYELVERDGKTGITFTNSIALDVLDEYLFDNPDGSEVYVDVEYYDGGRTNVFLHYDGYATALNVEKGFQNDKNTAYNRKDYLMILGNDPMWRVRRFVLTDLAAKNGVMGGYDVRLATWDLHAQHILSYSPVVRSIKVYPKPWPTPLRVTGWSYFEGSEKAGNMLSETEEPVLNLPLRNASAENSIKTKISVNVRNANDVLISTDVAEVELAPGEEKMFPMPVTNPKRYGVYYAEIVTETATEKGGKYGEYVADEPWKQADFSITHVWDENTLNQRYGINEQNHISGMIGSEILKRAGIGWVRLGQMRTWDALDGEGRFVDNAFPATIKAYSDNGVSIQYGARTSWYSWDSVLKGLFQASGIPDNVPTNEEDLNYFVKFAGDIAYQYRDLIDDVEIFNEPEGESTAFGGGARLAEIVKRMNEVLRRDTPNLSISGPSFMSYREDLLIPFLDNGGMDYLDTYSMHLYDWSGAWDVQKYGHDTGQQHIDLLAKKGYTDVPLWLTEVGFTSQDMRKQGSLTGQPAKASVFPEGASRRTQARNTVLANASFYAFNQYEKWFWHIIPDREDPTENEHCFGFINDKDGSQGYTPYSAKPNLVAVSGSNQFLKTDTQEKGIIGNSTDRLWAFHYYTPELDKDVMLFASEQLYSGQKSYNLGCNEVEVYDMFANYIGTMRSDDGIFTFSLFSEPFYVLGNFTKFEEAQKQPEIEPISVQATGVNADIAPFTLKRNTNKNYTIKVDDLEVVSNPGFIGDTAEIRVQAPAWDYGTAYSIISVFDEDGYLCYVSPGEIEIKDPVTVSFERFKFSEHNDTQWGIMAKVTNNALGKELTGEIHIDRPSNLVELNEVREFTNLKASTTITYIFNLPEMVNKQFINMRAILTLDSGFRAVVDKALDFTTAKYAYEKPAIDGVNTPGEWKSSWFGANKEENVFIDKTVPGRGEWTGTDDLSFTAQAMWDEEYMYLICVATDDIHTATCRNASPGNYANIWDMDGIQLAMHDEEDINVVLTGEFAEIGWGLEDTYGQVSWCWNKHYDASTENMELQDAKYYTKRYDGYTVYEIRISWDELFYDGYSVDPSKNMRMAILMNDKDGNEARYGMEYGGGIGKVPKDSTKFARMTLVY